MIAEWSTTYLKRKSSSDWKITHIESIFQPLKTGKEAFCSTVKQIFKNKKELFDTSELIKKELVM